MYDIVLVKVSHAAEGRANDSDGIVFGEPTLVAYPIEKFTSPSESAVVSR